MFERYTQKARRVVFFYRYEASRFGSEYIDTEHLLLGLLRENKNLFRWLPKANPENLTQRIEERLPRLTPGATSVDLPLSAAGTRVLKHAAAEADRLGHRHIGTEHLFLGLLDEKDCFAAEVLRDGGADAENLRALVGEPADATPMPGIYEDIRTRSSGTLSGGQVELHGVRLSADRVRVLVQHCRMYNWRWEKRSWTNLDVVVEKKSGELSFELSLASDSANFELVKGGWKKGHCFICHWELYESQEEEEDHRTGYTNGHDWVCAECYAKFWKGPDFFASAYGDIT